MLTRKHATTIHALLFSIHVLILQQIVYNVQWTIISIYINIINNIQHNVDGGDTYKHFGFYALTEQNSMEILAVHT